MFAYTQGIFSKYLKAIEVAILCTNVFSISVTGYNIFSARGQEQDGAGSRPLSNFTNEEIMYEETEGQPNPEMKFKDKDIKAELVFEGKMNPTSMAFLDNNDILLLEISNGTIFRIINGALQSEPVLDVNVSAPDPGERGLLGISVLKSSPGYTYVFLYFTEANRDGGSPIGNRIYKYEFIDNKLVNPKLILDLPAHPGPFHNGGAITVGPDGNVYVPIGDLFDEVTLPSTMAQNIENGEKPNGSGGILRVTQDGKPVGDGILGDEHPLNLYYAYGIRNSFGIDFDPVTGNLWDTENGPVYGDEINVVEPGFNSGWRKVQGIWYDDGGSITSLANVTEGIPKGLVGFNGKGKYSEPELTWKGNGSGFTALKFFDSDMLGERYANDIFVGDVHNGNLYQFELSGSRNQIILDGPHSDKVVDNKEEVENAIFAQGFTGGITDLEVGEDGYLYVVSGIWSDQGKIYRLIRTTE